MNIRLGALKCYREHLVSQYSDRCALWSLKDVSTDLLSRCVTLAVDGADQATWITWAHLFVFLLALTHNCNLLATHLFVNLSIQAKYHIPRSPELRTAHRMAKIQRPKLKLHACWAFGHVLRIAVIEEDSFAGSSMIQELIAVTIEDVMQECQRKGVASPDTLVVSGDNTVKELKNSFNLVFAAALVLHKKFKFLLPNLAYVMEETTPNM